MVIIIGLGNPGRRYAGHRHNIGFMAADEIHRRHRFSPWRARFEGELSEGLLDGERAIILKPATYMNESGRSVGQAMRFYKLAPADLVVIYDELDLPPGKLRMKKGGGTAGHRGLRSIEAHVGKDFRRMRLGIGHPGVKERVNQHVLGDFAKVDRAWVEPLLSAVADNAALLARGDDGEFMNRVHLAVTPEKDTPAADPPSTAAGAGKPDANRGVGGVLADGLRRLLARNR